jgi:RimJ/RimL family protein N-acetyltransferase
MQADIRQIREAEIASWYACLSGVVRERRYLAFLEPPPFDQARAFARGHIERGSPLLVALAPPASGEADDAPATVVGWCDVSPAIRQVSAHVGILGIGLAPAWRDMGLGRRLMTAALEAGWVWGFRRIELGVFAHNRRAHALYRKLGFVEEGRKRDHVLIDGTFHDEIMMAIVRT